MAWWTLLLACGGPEVVESTEDGLRRLSVTLDSNRDGVARFEIDVAPGESAVLLTARQDAPMTTHFLGLYDADDEPVWAATDWLGGSRSKTNAMYLGQTVNLNWPIASDDPPLTEGRWTVDLGVVSADSLYTQGSVELDALLKDDDDLSGGEVQVAVVWTSGLEEEEALVEAMDEALVQFQDLYAQAGLAVSVEELVWPEAPTGTPSADDDPTFADIAAAVSLATVPIVLVENIGGIDAFGLAGDIPGPLLSTNKSAVIVSYWLTAGLDLEFTEVETRILAETLAHETGHFLGLYHPVETTWEVWDALDDTDECDESRECEQTLGTNVMFPYPVCFPPPCTPQPDLSELQRSVLNRYTGTR